MSGSRVAMVVAHAPVSRAVCVLATLILKSLPESCCHTPWLVVDAGVAPCTD